jgi:hypothetical protein
MSSVVIICYRFYYGKNLSRLYGITALEGDRRYSAAGFGEYFTKLFHHLYQPNHGIRPDFISGHDKRWRFR